MDGLSDHNNIVTKTYNSLNTTKKRSQVEGWSLPDLQFTIHTCLNHEIMYIELQKAEFQRFGSQTAEFGWE